MKREDLERNLNRENTFGFTKETDNGDYIGWISLKKQKYNSKIEMLLDEDEESNLINEQRLIAQAPYVVEICELKKDIFESDEKWPEEKDYRLAEVYRFSDLDEVETFLAKYRKSLVEINWISDIPSL